MTLTDRFRNFWDRISPRERKLVVLLVIGVPIALAVWLGLAIRDGLVAMEDRNQTTRDALEIIEQLKAAGPQQAAADQVKIPDEPIALETYVSKAAEKSGLAFKGSIDTRKAARNGFVTTTVSVSLDDISTDQLKAFLQEVETGNRTVVVTHLDVHQDFRDHTKLDASFEISAYSKDHAKASGSGEDKDG